MIYTLQYCINNDLHKKLTELNQLEKYHKIAQRNSVEKLGKMISERVPFKEDDSLTSRNNGHYYKLQIEAFDISDWITFINQLGNILRHTDPSTRKDVMNLIKELESK